jgi:hypothetical protein
VSAAQVLVAQVARTEPSKELDVLVNFGVRDDYDISSYQTVSVGLRFKLQLRSWGKHVILSWQSELIAVNEISFSIGTGRETVPAAPCPGEYLCLNSHFKCLLKTERPTDKGRTMSVGRC